MEKNTEKVVTVRMHEIYNTRLPAKPKAKPKARPKAGPKQKLSAGAFAAELFFSVLLLAVVSAFRTVLVYANNTNLVSFSDVAKPMWLYIGVSVAVFALLRIFLRRQYFACVFVAFGTFLLINLDWLIGFVRLFVNEYRSAVIGSFILYAVLLAGFFFFIRMLYKKKVHLHSMVKILAATFTCLVLFNVVTAFINLGKIETNQSVAAIAPVEAPSTPTQAAPKPTPSSQTAVPTSSTAPVSQEFGRPNIYFFIMDEFSSFDMMQKYYGYDAKPFNDYLISAGFNISRESYGTDNQTEHAICDLMNIDYISRPLSKDKCVSSIRNGKLHEILTDLGYTEYQIANSTYFKGLDSLISDSNEEGDTDPTDKTDFGDVDPDEITGGLGGIISGLLDDPDPETKVDEAALNQFGFYPSDYIRNTNEYKTYKDKSKLARGYGLLKKFDYLQDPSNYASLATPRITYSYMLATHVPFVFNEYGGILPFIKNRNWEDTSVYLNQYKFINKQLIATLSSIIQNDPNSIIILMSDHGIRYHGEASTTYKHKFYITDKDSCRVMNAVYIKGQKYDIEGLSGVNTLRYILSLYDGQDYPPIEDPITSDSPENLTGIIPHHR